MNGWFGNVASLVLMPFVLAGLILRVKSLASGRKGQPLLQPAYDVLRLLRKSPVYGTVTTPVFRIAPWVFLLTALGSAAIVPVWGSQPLVSFPFDFVWFAYVWGLGRVALLLGALDTGSAFQGMGSARDATFSALVEPVLFLVAGALCLRSGTHALADGLRLAAGGSLLLRLSAALALLIVLQVECARMPVDDPSTHLELTMVHEVMVLDHSGPDLAAIQLASMLKLFVGASLIATLCNPWAGSGTLLGAAANLALSALVAVSIGAIESMIARLRLRLVPEYVSVALGLGAAALLLGAWGAASGP